MKKITKKFSIVAIALLAFAMASCESREQESYGDGVALATPVVKVDKITYDTMSFSWTPVTGAVEYGYMLYDKNGNLIEGNTTKDTSVTITGLDYNTSYTIKVYAYPAVTHEQTGSAGGTLTEMSGFFDIINTGGTYTSAITEKSWTTPVLTETRPVERQFGSFILSSWYNKTGYDLAFTVYNDSLIHITNGTVDETTGLRKVSAGPNNISTNAYIRKGVLINEDSCRFNILTKTLSLYVLSTTGSKSGRDIFVWE